MIFTDSGAEKSLTSALPSNIALHQATDSMVHERIWNKKIKGGNFLQFIFFLFPPLTNKAGHFDNKG